VVLAISSWRASGKSERYCFTATSRPAWTVLSSAMRLSPSSMPRGLSVSFEHFVALKSQGRRSPSTTGASPGWRVCRVQVPGEDELCADAHSGRQSGLHARCCNGAQSPSGFADAQYRPCSKQHRKTFAFVGVQTTHHLVAQADPACRSPDSVTGALAHPYHERNAYCQSRVIALSECYLMRCKRRLQRKFMQCLCYVILC